MSGFAISTTGPASSLVGFFSMVVAAALDELGTGAFTCSAATCYSVLVLGGGYSGTKLLAG